MAILKIVSGIAHGLISVMLFAFFIRAILSWFDNTSDFIEKVRSVAVTITEPFVIPVRKVLSRFEWVRTFPMDISFTVTMLIFVFLDMIII